MCAKEDPENNERRNALAGYAKYTTMGFQMIGIIGVLTYAGYRIDEAYAHPVKWVTAVLSLAGVCISLYLVFRSLKSS
ncbi:MAG: AtpZ/AtpI family protein [Mucilaginibacter polytrichastri]|nr:AtpZ/AtpI family protein [Mucilaginibacter polytrichastri]